MQKDAAATEEAVDPKSHEQVGCVVPPGSTGLERLGSIARGTARHKSRKRSCFLMTVIPMPGPDSVGTHLD